MQDTFPQEQLLGEIPTKIVGVQYHDAAVRAGEHVNLEREPENEHDTNAIRVENPHFRPIGHVAKPTAAWLAPLIDAGWLRVDGYVPQWAGSDEPRQQRSYPLTLTAFLTAKGRGVLEKTEVRDRAQALHQLVLQVYQDAHTYCDAKLVLELAEGLRPLERQELLPETHLLLALLPGIARELQAAQGMRSVVKLRDALAGLAIRTPLHHCNLTLFPLIWPDEHQPPYTLLQDAIEAGEAVVEEINEAGSVPNLLLNNKSRRPVLIPEGDILKGAKQNRVINVTVLVAAGTKFVLPVSCVEQGRWRYSSKHFATCACAPPSLRSKKTRSVQQNRRERGVAMSDQGEVWQEVAKNLDDVRACSPTSSLLDGFAAAEDRLEQYRCRLKLPSEAAGVLVASADRVLAVDLFDSPRTLAATWKRLSDAYFLDAVRSQRETPPTEMAVAQQFLGSTAERARPRVPALGLGEELEIVGSGIVGAALLYADKVCHLAAFSDVD